MFISKIEARIVTLDHQVFVFAVRSCIQATEVMLDAVLKFVMLLFKLANVRLAKDL